MANPSLSRMTAADIRFNQCGTVRCEPEWSWHPRAKHLPDYDLWFVWAGEGELVATDRRYALRPGTLFILRPGGVYDATHNPRNPLGVCFLHFELWQKQRRLRLDEHLPFHSEVADVPFVESLLRRTVDLALAAQPAGLALAVQLFRAVLTIVQHTPVRASRSSPLQHQLLEIARQIRETPGQPWSVESLAAQLKLTPDGFSRAFASVHGVTPKRFIVQERIRRAQQLLRDSSLSIEQIALAVGYGDLFTFSKRFKLVAGMPPRAWRGQV